MRRSQRRRRTKARQAVYGRRHLAKHGWLFLRPKPGDRRKLRSWSIGPFTFIALGDS